MGHALYFVSDESPSEKDFSTDEQAQEDDDQLCLSLPPELPVTSPNKLNG
jgi:hypothetical protein